MKNNQTKSTPPIAPLDGIALPILLITVSVCLCLALVIINAFVYPVSDSVLAPIIAQIIALLIPCYMFCLLSLQNKPFLLQAKEMRLILFKPSNVFFIIFASLFMMCASLLLEIIFGGTYLLSDGFCILGAFTAGKNEFSSSYAYLILSYAILPAILEEIFFRGIIFNQTRKFNFILGVFVSSFASALFGFSLGGFIPAFFCGIMFIFVLYTTKSLLSCIIMHFLFNLYRLLLESNIAAYFHSVNNNILLLITIFIALLISGILFFGEASKTYRQKAQDIYEKREISEHTDLSVKRLSHDLKCILAYKPNLICFIISLVAYISIIVIRIIG